MDKDLASQTERLRELYSADSENPGLAGEIHGLLGRLVEGMRQGAILEADLDQAAVIRDQLPGSTLSLILQRIITGRSDPIDGGNLRRWIAATDAERGPGKGGTHGGR